MAHASVGGSQWHRRQRHLPACMHQEVADQAEGGSCAGVLNHVTERARGTHDPWGGQQDVRGWRAALRCIACAAVGRGLTG